MNTLNTTRYFGRNIVFYRNRSSAELDVDTCNQVTDHEIREQLTALRAIKQKLVDAKDYNRLTWMDNMIKEKAEQYSTANKVVIFYY